MEIAKQGVYKQYTHMAVPLCQGDYYVDPETGAAFRCIGTVPNFFTDIVLDIDTEETFTFAQGRCFVEESPEHGFFECVVGSTVARRCDLELGDKIQATHGAPDSEGAHIHEQNYTIVGIIEATGTPNDGAVFLNLEGFFLMEDHAKNVEDDSVLGLGDEDEDDEDSEPAPVDEFFADDDEEEQTDPSPAQATESETSPNEDSDNEDSDNEGQENEEPDKAVVDAPDEMSASAALAAATSPEETQLTEEEEFIRKQNATRIPLPIEQREVTSILVRTSRTIRMEPWECFWRLRSTKAFSIAHWIGHRTAPSKLKRLPKPSIQSWRSPHSSRNSSIRSVGCCWDSRR